MSNIPQGRTRQSQGTGQMGQRQGGGLGTGPVRRPAAGGGGSGSSGGTGSSGGGGVGGGYNGGRRMNRGSMGGGRNGGGFNPMLLIVIAVVLLLGGRLGFNGGDGGTPQATEVWVTAAPQAQVTATARPRVTATPRPTAKPTATPKAKATRKPAATAQNATVWDLIGGGSAQTAYSESTDNQAVSTQVAAGAREKFTRLKGNGRDTVTLMLYLCGTDLESRSGMATRDLQEILKASYGDNVKVIVYSGGCSRWQNNAFSTSQNQTWRLRNGKVEALGSEPASAMTNPDNLTNFIRFCAENYPASRYGLILWDHGGGSVSGYGYDEKYKSSGSMSLPSIKRALSNARVQFDFIGFDACLMATVETALVCSDYADYLIASEETEPGVGWYYTHWLTELGKNTSMPTTELGRMICDDFVQACSTQARGQKTTLSVVDLAELAATVPGALKDFSQTVTGMVKQGDYRQISNARHGAREFATSSKIDQVDLADLANRVGGESAQALSEAVRGAVKYNRSGSLSGAYGLSIYFPYQKTSNVNRAISNYQSIGMDDSYGECIRAFASLEAGGQAAMGHATPVQSLGGGGYESFSMDSISDLLSLFLRSNPDRAGGMDAQELTGYIGQNALDGASLVFEREAAGLVLRLSADQWALVQDVDLNLFYDDGEGYVDLGADNIYQSDTAGGLIADESGVWVALNGLIVPYYRESGTALETWGYIPVLLDGERAEILTRWTQDGGYQIVGVRRVYQSETDTVAKAVEAIEPTSTIQVVCDYYTYSGEYRDSYRYGNPISCADGLRIQELDIPEPEKILCTYRLIDLYRQSWWTNAYTLGAGAGR